MKNYVNPYDLIKKKHAEMTKRKNAGAQQGSNTYVDYLTGYTYIWYNQLLQQVFLTKNPHHDWQDFREYSFCGVWFNGDFRSCRFVDRPHSKEQRANNANTIMKVGVSQYVKEG